jgi:P-type E1-E2 ATPase
LPWQVPFWDAIIDPSCEELKSACLCPTLLRLNFAEDDHVACPIRSIGEHHFPSSGARVFLFSVALAVGMTPEMMPMIITVTLAQGAKRMTRKKVLVKQLAAIEDFGSIDILCTDKTGTLTEGEIVLDQHVDFLGKDNEDVLCRLWDSAINGQVHCYPADGENSRATVRLVKSVKRENKIDIGRP